MDGSLTRSRVVLVFWLILRVNLKLNSVAGSPFYRRLSTKRDSLMSGIPSFLRGSGVADHSKPIREKTSSRMAIRMDAGLFSSCFNTEKKNAQPIRQLT